MRSETILVTLKAHSRAENREGMRRYGINVSRAYGVSMPILRGLAREIGKDHGLAAELWRTGVHEARILACLIDDPRQVMRSQMDAWAREFDSWDLCDQACNNLFRKTPFAHAKAARWSKAKAEFVKRAGFVMMACLAVHDKAAPDRAFEPYLARIRDEATDERNMVRKAVNWALRQIGKRNLRLNGKAIRTAETVAGLDSKAARWVARDALRELKGEKVQAKLRA